MAGRGKTAMSSLTGGDKKLFSQEDGLLLLEPGNPLAVVIMCISHDDGTDDG